MSKGFLKRYLENNILSIFNNFIVSLDTVQYNWMLHGEHYPLIGKHTLQVYACTEYGDVAHPFENFI